MKKLLILLALLIPALSVSASSGVSGTPYNPSFGTVTIATSATIAGSAVPAVGNANNWTANQTLISTQSGAANNSPSFYLQGWSGSAAQSYHLVVDTSGRLELLNTNASQYFLVDQNGNGVFSGSSLLLGGVGGQAVPTVVSTNTWTGTNNFTVTPEAHTVALPQVASNNTWTGTNNFTVTPEAHTVALPQVASNNTWTGTNNFTGSVQSSGANLLPVYAAQIQTCTSSCTPTLYFQNPSGWISSLSWSAPGSVPRTTINFATTWPSVYSCTATSANGTSFDVAEIITFTTTAVGFASFVSSTLAYDAGKLNIICVQ